MSTWLKSRPAPDWFRLSIRLSTILIVVLAAEWHGRNVGYNHGTHDGSVISREDGYRHAIADIKNAHKCTECRERLEAAGLFIEDVTAKGGANGGK